MLERMDTFYARADPLYLLLRSFQLLIAILQGVIVWQQINHQFHFTDYLS